MWQSDQRVNFTASTRGFLFSMLCIINIFKFSIIFLIIQKLNILCLSDQCVCASLLRQLWKSTSCARKGFPCVMDTVKELGFEDFFSYFSPTTYCLYFCSTVASKILSKRFCKVPLDSFCRTGGTEGVRGLLNHPFFTLIEARPSSFNKLLLILPPPPAIFLSSAIPILDWHIQKSVFVQNSHNVGLLIWIKKT